MSRTWFVSDTHFGHANILNFKMPDGVTPLRKFATIEEHDETIIANWNKLIQPADRVYHMGDIVINRRCLPILNRLNGRKKLIKGNHDIFKLKDYVPYFDDILAYRTYPEQGIIVSHIPVHETQLENRFKWNLHGHLHGNKVRSTFAHHPNIGDDPRYLNLCVEWTDFKPVEFDEILTRIGWEKNGK